ncbi:MAG: hypothetical protein RBU45_13690 [Myxococcota bacterium]|jgi:hypothetical protein|nr:hypothetical protein [Myxococcota bacterium]
MTLRSSRIPWRWTPAIGLLLLTLSVGGPAFAQDEEEEEEEEAEGGDEAAPEEEEEEEEAAPEEEEAAPEEKAAPEEEEEAAPEEEEEAAPEEEEEAAPPARAEESAAGATGEEEPAEDEEAAAPAEDEEAGADDGEGASPAPGRRAVEGDVLEGMDDEEAILEPLASEEGEGEEVDDTTIAIRIAEITDIYLTYEKRRDPLERIIVDGPRAEIWFLQAMSGRPAEVEKTKCNAYQWLFFGRLNRSRGVKEVFQRFPKLQEIRLSLFTIETRINPDGRRGYRQYRKADPKMEITVSKETARAIDLLKLKEKLTGEGCVAEGERIIDKRWYATAETAK